jgi:hypothetical protein
MSHRVSDERLRAFVSSFALPNMYLAGGDVLAMAQELLERRERDAERRMPWSGRGVQQDGGCIAEDDGA